jgi:hypothetical protein
MAVDASATMIDVEMAARAPSFVSARVHHSVVKPGGGHVRVELVENELATTTKIGT